MLLKQFFRDHFRTFKTKESNLELKNKLGDQKYIITIK